MNGEEIFERTSQKYADCRTYSDSGRVENDGGVMTFKTHFVRPNLFKFEFGQQSEEQGKSGVIWSDGNEFFSSFDSELDHIPCDNIGSLLGMLGSSIGAPFFLVPILVPMMLMSDYAGDNSLTNAGPYISTEHTSIADRSCHRIKSSNPEFAYVADLLIDSLGFKLRRMIVEFATGAKSQVVFTDVSFDREISEDIFNIKHG